MTVSEELKARVRAAQAAERDHSNSTLAVRRELAGYTRGLADALYVVSGDVLPDLTQATK